MRGLSLHQPFASLIALGEKQIETRGRRTGYRGDVAICATKFPPLLLDPALDALFRSILRRYGTELESLPNGAAVCVVELTHDIPVEEAVLLVKRRLAKKQSPRHELTLGDYTPGRRAWILQRVRPLVEPYPIRGMQGLFPIAVADQVKIRQRILAPRDG
jgi:hypothetical protein